MPADSSFPHGRGHQAGHFRVSVCIANHAETKQSICAVLVAFHPDAGLHTRLERVLPQVSGFLVVDNTPSGGCKERLADLLATWPTLCVVENRENLGVGTALNQGLEHATAIGASWLLTLDQDSLCHPNMVQTLLAAASACPLPVAVVGANYHDPRNDRYEADPGLPGEWEERKTVITSGSLVNVAVARRIGGFRADYFIDQLDHEFCLRARRHAYRIIITGKPVLEHSVGEEGGLELPLLGILPRHPALRRYYITRNSLTTIGTYWRSEPAWCLRRLVKLVLGILVTAAFERGGQSMIRASWAGARDAVLGRVGRCTEAFS